MGTALSGSLQDLAPAASLGSRHSRLQDVPKDMLLLSLVAVQGGYVARVLLGTWREIQLLCDLEQLLAFSGPEGLNRILLKESMHMPGSGDARL